MIDREITTIDRIIELLSEEKCQEILMSDTKKLNSKETRISENRIKSLERCISILKVYGERDCDEI